MLLHRPKVEMLVVLVRNSVPLCFKHTLVASMNRPVPPFRQYELVVEIPELRKLLQYFANFSMRIHAKAETFLFTRQHVLKQSFETPNPHPHGRVVAPGSMRKLVDLPQHLAAFRDLLVEALFVSTKIASGPAIARYWYERVHVSVDLRTIAMPSLMHCISFRSDVKAFRAS